MLKAVVALHFPYYDFMRTYRLLREIPALAAGIGDSLAKWEGVLDT